MNQSRSNMVVRITSLSVLLATPTTMLVAGAIFFAFSLGPRTAEFPVSDQVVVVDPEFAIGDEGLQPSIIQSAPGSFDQESSDQGQPILVSIPELGVDSFVTPVSSYSGVMEIPEDISTVGWFVGGSTPGDEQGSAVMVGHRDGVEAGRGAFYSLSTLSEGDMISVRTSEGLRIQYRVSQVEAVDKDDLPAVADKVFSREGKPRLTLITCGGDYVRDEGGYQENIIVTARPTL